MAESPIISLRPIQNNKVLVNYIPTDFEKSKLVELFEPFGPILQMGPFKGTEQLVAVGYCVVTLNNNNSASRSIAALNGLRVQNKILKVDFASKTFPKADNLYITNLPIDMEEGDLVKLLKHYGTIINFRFIYRNVLLYGNPPPETLTISTGKAFVLYNEPSESENAYFQLNGMILKEYGKHKVLNVTKCRKSFWNPRRDIFISNLPPFVGEAELLQGFSVNGSVLNVKVLRDSVTQKSLRRGFLRMRSHNDALNIIRQLNGALYYGLDFKLYVTFAKRSVRSFN